MTTVPETRHNPWRGGPPPQIPDLDDFVLLSDRPSGVVWRARHVKRKIPVAVKVVIGIPDPRSPLGPETRLPLPKELVALYEARGNDVATILGAGFLVNPRRVYFVTEFMDRGTLKSALTRRELDPGERITVMLHAASALARLHRNGLAHLDIKPSNIGLASGTRHQRGQLTVKLLDFGTAIDERAAESGLVYATPKYCSPEQVTGHGIGSASDCYSFGCVLYEALEGVPPVNESTIEGCLRNHARSAPPVPRLEQVRTNHRRENLRRLIGALLMKDPEARPPMDLTKYALANLHNSRLLDGYQTVWQTHSTLASPTHAELIDDWRAW